MGWLLDRMLGGCVLLVVLLTLPAWILITISIFITFYLYSIWTFFVFRAAGIPGPLPWPVVGTLMPILKKGVLQGDLECITQYGQIVGTFEGRTPVLIISDMELLKTIMIKDFHSFQNRRDGGLGEYPLRRTLTRLRDDHWKHVRSLLTPSFSSAKLRLMIPKIQECSRIFVEHLETLADRGESFEVKSYCGAFSMDVIALTAFGMKIDSHNKDDPFVKHAQKVFTFNIKKFILFLLLLFPCITWLLKKLDVRFFPPDTNEFFVKVINDAIDQRSHSQPRAVDFLQMMIDAKVNDTDIHSGVFRSGNDVIAGPDGDWTKRGLTHEEILAQSLLFFLAGYETTATTLSLVAYCLATHPHCQDKLLVEIDAALQDVDEEESIPFNKLPYLDMCINETLRLYPPALRINRICSRTSYIGGYTIPKGTVVVIPIYALHHDPRLWPAPEMFIPERFAAEKMSRPRFDFMPFGAGPRHCMGQRLAMLEMKIALVHLLRRYSFHVTPQTQIPLKLTKKGLLQPENGVFLRLASRNT